MYQPSARLTASVAALGCLFTAGTVARAALVGHWHPDDWAGGGNNWTDRVGAKVATVGGDPLVAYAAFNGSRGIVLDGDDQFNVDAANNPAVGKNFFTVIAVFRTGTPGANNDANFWNNSGIVGGEAAGAPNDWGLTLLAQGTPRAFFCGGYVDAADAVPLDGKPHTVALTWSDVDAAGDGILRFYVDGVFKAQSGVQNGGVGLSNSGFAIGANAQGGGARFTGTIGQVRLYDSIENIATLHAALVTQDASLIGRWVADDYSGTGNWVDRVSGKIATPVSDPSVQSGAIGAASCANGIYFDGNDRFDVSAANNPAVGKRRFTLIASFKTTTPGLNDSGNYWINSAIVGGEGPGTPNDWGLCVLLNKSARGFFRATQITDGDVVDGRVHTMAVTWSDVSYAGNDGIMRFYVDGVLKGVSGVEDGGDGIFNDGFAIAASEDGSSYFYTGTIGELRIYDAVEDVAALHEAMTDQAGLVGRWVADDWSGSGNWLDRVKGWAAVPAGSPAKANNALQTLAVTNGVYFNGSSRFDVSAANNPAVGATKFTVIASFKTTTGGANNNDVDWWNNTGIVGAEAPANHNDWGLMLLQNGSAKCALTTERLTDGSVIDGRLHTLALTWSDPSFGGDAMLRLYVDGVLKATHNGHNADVDNGIYNYAFAIAAGYSGAATYYTGTLGEVRLYSQVKDIGQLHSDMTGKGLFAHWHANDFAGANWVDRIQGVQAVKVGSPAAVVKGLDHINGVQFGGSDRFDVAQADNPAVGKLRFTLAASFRTLTPGANDSANFWENSAFVGGEAVGTERNDWGLCLLQNQSLRGYWANQPVDYAGGVLDGWRHTLGLTWTDRSAGGDARMRFYVDGVLRATTAPADYYDGVDAAGFAIGANQYGGAYYYTGQLGEVRMYDNTPDMLWLHYDLLPPQRGSVFLMK